MLRDLKTLIILGFLLANGIFFGFFYEWTPPEPVTTVEVVRDTTYIEVLKEVPKYVPKYTLRVDTVEVPADVDTVAILKDYYAEYVYADTLRLDSLGVGYITDTVTQNRITTRSLMWDYEIPVIKETTTITHQLPPLRRNELYIGPVLGGDKQSISYIGLGLGLKTKNSKLYTVSVGLLGQEKSNFGAVIGIYTKIGKK